ncbi:MAG: zinc-dependent peptidase [Myxococcota bacterium]|nr:zinc-dependent peptidase [Myxococcota bacterium]
MFGWLKERRRKRIVAEPFPREWDAIIDAYVPLAWRLQSAERQRLRELVQIFIAEKTWEGCSGLDLTEEMQVIVAANACLLVLDRGIDLYKDVDSILLYPNTVITPPRRPFMFETVRTPIGHARAISGEAMLHGPVVLSWDAVIAGTQWDAHGNVVVHEFAHKIDMADGSVDGTPPLGSEREVADWARVWSAAYRDVTERVAYGLPCSIDPYGATNEAELFAVATETYFLNPAGLRWDYPELFAQLDGLYGRYEAGWQGRADLGLVREHDLGRVQEEAAFETN